MFKSGNRFRIAIGTTLALLLGLLSFSSRADSVVATVATDLPNAIALNPVTNQIYVNNQFRDTVTVIDGATNATTTVPTGSQPMTLAVNAVTNKIYVANYTGANVTVINGADNTTATVAAGSNPRAVAVNSVTNKIYVPNQGSNTVTVIDGTNNTTATVPTGSFPVAVAVNETTNKIYVVNRFGGTVTVIDGTNNTTATVSVGTQPFAVAVNSVTNKIYVTNLNSSTVTVINGANNTTSTVVAGTQPFAVAVNSTTNKIYVTNRDGANVTVINGADNTTATVTVGSTPHAVAVNEATNKIYVANWDSNNVTVIRGASNATATVAVGVNPNAVAANAQTNRIYVANGNGSSVSVIDGTDNATTRVRADFSGDGRSDIVWRNASTGENYVYPMNGTTILAGEGYLRTVADLNWTVAGIGDFDGDGKADILWRNTSTGENYIYFIDGTAIKPTEGFIRTVADQSWQVAGIGDFDGDGKDDILWRNSTTGENYLYPMNGLSIKPTEGYLRTVADQSWQVAGIGDFDGDGKADILWRNSASGQNYLYPMNGTAIKASEGFIRTVADPAWQVKGVGDFDGDGKADIVWRNSSSGQNYLYPMDGMTIKPTEGYLRTVADLAWQIAAVGDYDGDGKSDLLWRNSSTGDNYLYPMDGTSIKPSEGYLRTVPQPSWQVVGQ